MRLHILREREKPYAPQALTVKRATPLLEGLKATGYCLAHIFTHARKRK
jgi:hypothetical protein